ncbi:outer membrane protein [Mesorhizobium sp. L-8-10]|uniref:porin n=1 Tax=Mesorhizobium sp. L-8-10 TaxID=2744523 RepID=UPI0019289F69|nr:porin [Mesorhizobium sp. L-8-10]BCH33893.1 outer membrane protein [Mesorhizobium sp. L-8-10]
MNIKSLLLGSAAALVAVSGARAADAVVVAEPEPVEYVRVCDTYGSGFFYIPGTETCLSISGYVWYQLGTNNFDPFSPDPQTPPYIGGRAGEGWYKSTRARVNIESRSETEWGTLRGMIRLQADWGGLTRGPGNALIGAPFADGPVAVDQGWLALGGFQAGYTESAWAASFRGGATNFGSHSWGGMYYGYAQRHQMSYTFFGGNGWFGTLSLEDDALQGDGYVPDVVAKVGVNQGWGSVWARFGWEDDITDTVDAGVLDENESGWGAALAAQINVPNSPGSSLRLFAFYADSDTRFSSGSALGVAPEWSILASYNQQFSETLGVSIAGQYFADLYEAGTSDKMVDADGDNVNAWGMELSAVWTPVTNFEVRPELHYDKVDGYDASYSGFLRFTRYF